MFDLEVLFNYLTNPSQIYVNNLQKFIVIVAIYSIYYV